MKLLKSVFIFVLILRVFSVYGGALPGKGKMEKVVAMCRPTAKQIRNVEEMVEKNLLHIKKIKLLCIYHEDEWTNYTSSYKYKKDNVLSWVTFVKIRGEVKPNKLFTENKWTTQFKKIFEKSDGIIFTGGADLLPSIYGKETYLLTDPSTPVRALYEISFMFHLIGGHQNPGFVPFLESRKEYPVLGLCLGSQVMNVAAGGTLVQDIPSEIYELNTMDKVLKQDQDRIHSSTYIKQLNPLEKNLSPAFHKIRFRKNSEFVKKMRMKPFDTPHVLTSHHQAVKKLGKHLMVSATSMDGRVVEAIEHRRYKNVIGVQFHPENYILYKKGRYFRCKPGMPLNFNLRDFLINNPPSMIFHQNIWKWFSQSL